MIIYLAATAPGNETKQKRGMLGIRHRLLSYFLIVNRTLDCDKVFKAIKDESNLRGSRTT
jgi:hypothetical protein